MQFYPFDPYKRRSLKRKPNLPVRAESMIAPPNGIDSTSPEEPIVTVEEPNIFRPSLLQAGEQIRPPERMYGTPSGPMMPPPPGPRIQAPVYEEPEPMGWKKGLLGVVLSGLAGLSGQGAQTADTYFNEPRRRAETDFAREMGQWHDQENSWENFYAGLGRQDRTDLERLKFRETQRHNLIGEAYQRNSEPNIDQWEYRREVQSQSMFGIPWEQATVEQAKQIEDSLTANQGGLYLVPDERGIPRWRSKNEAMGLPGTRTVFREGQAELGGVPGVSLNQPRQRKTRGLSDYQRSQTIRQRDEDLVDAEFEEQEKEQINKRYDEILVRGYQHTEGDKMPPDVAREYRRVAGSQAQAEAWAVEDGWDISR